MTKYEKMHRDRRETEEKKLLRVGAYCRVSTDKGDQANSFESQQRYFREYIERQSNWELTEIFADEGKSGTSTKRRASFNNMIDAAKRGKLDLIITKEISRFARNTLDSIYYTRELKRIGVGVVFVNDNINTLEPDAELRLTIMSSIAQEESRRTSERVKWGQRRRMEQGVVFGRDMLGYDVRGGKMFINEEGAKIVHLIFHKFVVESKGCHTIARELREAGIQTSSRMKEWSDTAILRVIRNEKYCGDLVQKKTFTSDYLSHEKKRNRGEEEFVILKDHHQPIISRQTFEQAGAILDSRAPSRENKTKHGNRYPLSGKMKCGKCAASLVPHSRKRGDGSRVKTWRCYEASRNGAPKVDAAGNHVGCKGTRMYEDEAICIIRSLMSSIDLDRKKIRQSAMRLAHKAIENSKPDLDVSKLRSRLRRIEEKRTKLLDLYISDELPKSEYIATRYKCDTQVEELYSQIEMVHQRGATAEKHGELLADIESAIDELVSGDTRDEDFYREFLSRIVVNDNNHIDAYLNLLPFRWCYAI
ncbi:MAG: recombinase family protein [Oscillospiraceae bacterium]|nr:recombinase family protein [Oscillospiraceae bacterium]